MCVAGGKCLPRNRQQQQAEAFRNDATPEETHLTPEEIPRTQHGGFQRIEAEEPSVQPRHKPLRRTSSGRIKTRNSQNEIRQTIKIREKPLAKSGKVPAKAASRTIKTADNAAKATVKTARTTAEATRKAAAATARAAKTTAQGIRVAAQAAATAA